jgi:nucleoside-diphosphate-sugar epimerase
MYDCDALVHFASYGVTPQPATWEEAFYWNVVQSMKTLEMAIESGIDRIIIAGSAVEYGLSSINHEFIPVTANLEPVGPYAISKVCLYFLAKRLCLENNVKMSYLRVFSAFGEGQYMNNLWPSLKVAALKGEDFNMTLGEQVRDFIHVDKATRMFIDELKYGDVNNGEVQIKNVGTGVSQTVLEFSKYWWNFWNARGNLIVGSIPYRNNEIMRMVPKI